MKVIYNRIIPFKGFKAINIFGVLFVRKGCSMREKDFNHESIHTVQMKEMLYGNIPEFGTILNDIRILEEIINQIK